MMNTAKRHRPLGWLPPSMPAHPLGQWLSAARDWYRQRRAAAGTGTARPDDSLVELDARTLRDIGAPHTLLARAQQRRQALCDQRHELRGGGAAGDWQGW